MAKKKGKGKKDLKDVDINTGLDQSRGCNLECVKKQNAGEPTIHEFVGPVKIILVDTPPEEYRRKICIAGCLGLANILIGATLIVTLFFTLNFDIPFIENLHIVLCTIGFHLFSSVAIMTISPLYGPSAPMRRNRRKTEHMILQILALIFVGSGTAAIILMGHEGFAMTLHSVLGYGAVGLAGLSALTGPFAYCAPRQGCCGDCLKVCHVFFGTPAFIAASLCLVTGLLKPCYMDWYAMAEIPFVLMFCILVYTCIVISGPSMKCIKCDFST